MLARAGVDAVCAPARRRARRGTIQPLELGAIGGQRPPPVGRHARDQPLERHVEPDRQRRPLDRRRGSADRRTCRRRWPRRRAARRPARAARPARRRGSTARRASRKCDATVCCSRCSIISSMSTACQSSRRARARATVVLPGAHEPDEINLVGFHADAAAAERRRRSPGRKIATASAPSMREGPLAASAAIANAIAIR